jgi:hypothetical protein
MHIGRDMHILLAIPAGGAIRQSENMVWWGIRGETTLVERSRMRPGRRHTGKNLQGDSDTVSTPIALQRAQS